MEINQILMICFLIILTFTRAFSLPASNSPPRPRYGHNAVLVGSNLYIIGGMEKANSQPLNEMLMVDLNNKTFNTTWLPWENVKSKVAGLTVPQTAWGAACAASNNIYLFGGIALVNGRQSVSSICSNKEFCAESPLL